MAASRRLLVAGSSTAELAAADRGVMGQQTAFIDLLRAGYIGSDASITETLRTLIAGVLTGNESLVIAVPRLTHPTREGEQPSAPNARMEVR